MRAVVAGATGLIGSFLVDRMKADSDVESVTALSRREKTGSGKITWTKVNFDKMSELEKACEGADHAFCCLGTTMKQAGSKVAFRKVDHDYVLAFAKASRSQGIESFSVVSAIGSDADSSFFYNKVKGEMEKDLEKVGFKSLHIFQPSILLGPREEKRLGEKLGIIGMKIISPLMFGSLKKYKPIHVKTVADAMLDSAKNPEAGTRHFVFEDMAKDH